MEEGSSGGAAVAGAEDVMARFSLDVSAGCGGRHSTLLDEYERLAFEVQLNRAIVLCRCYSEPSPVRFVQQPAGGAPPAPAPAPRERTGPGEAAGRFWRLHEVLGWWLQAFEPVVRWLRSAWEHRRWKEQDAAAPRGPPPTVPRVQLLDYLRNCSAL